jgi:hypothetical protein
MRREGCTHRLRQVSDSPPFGDSTHASDINLDYIDSPTFQKWLDFVPRR